MQLPKFGKTYGKRKVDNQLVPQPHASGKEQRLISYISPPTPSSSSPPPPQPKASPKNGSEYVFFLLKKAFEDDIGGNYGWSLAWAQPDFRIDYLNDNENYFIFVHRHHLEREEKEYLILHQCRTTTRECCCSVAPYILQLKHEESRKIVGHFNSYVNQKQLIYNVLRHCLDFQDMFILMARLSRIRLDHGIMNSPITRNFLINELQQVKPSPRLKEAEMQYIFKRGVVDDDFDLIPKLRKYEEELREIANVDVVRVFEDGEIGLLKHCDNFKKALGKSMEAEKSVMVIKKVLWSYMVMPPEDLLVHPALSNTYLKNMDYYLKVT